MSQNYVHRLNVVLFSVKALRWLLILATLLFLLGLFLPMITISKFMVINNSISIISGLAELVSQGQILIFLTVGIFSVVLPICKIGFLFLLLQSNITSSKQYKKLLYFMHEYGRWTMLDGGGYVDCLGKVRCYCQYPSACVPLFIWYCSTVVNVYHQ